MSSVKKKEEKVSKIYEKLRESREQYGKRGLPNAVEFSISASCRRDKKSREPAPHPQSKPCQARRTPPGPKVEISLLKR